MDAEPGTVLPSSPSRRFGTGALATMLVLGAAGGAAVSAVALRMHSAEKSATAQPGPTTQRQRRYVCPMHPKIVSDHPADCPVCGMKLVALKDEVAAEKPPVAQGQQKFVCPMHPTIVSDHQADCPVCGMKLVAMTAVDPATVPASKAPARKHKVAFYWSRMDPMMTSHTLKQDDMEHLDYIPVFEDELDGKYGPVPPDIPWAPVPGLADVSIDPQRQLLIGLGTAAVSAGPVAASWKTVGKIAVDETRVHRVNVKFAGFVEHVYADYVGKRVKVGDPLFSIYSPDLLSLQEEYLLALRTQQALAGGKFSGTAGKDLVEASRDRLRLWDIRNEEIARLEKTRTPRKSITLYAPSSGTIIKKDVVTGSRLQQGDTPYEITDLSEVWGLADAYESDLARVSLGMPASFRLPAYPDRVFNGKVVFIDPVLDPKTRTAKIRLSFPNPDGELRPEMFGEVTFETAKRSALRIPTDAIIDSGTKKVVFVALDDGKFQPREVQIGLTDSEFSEVLAGLGVYDKVVTRANFLVDSESRLRSSFAAMKSSR